MSLIEQAAQRLAELRRSGAELPDGMGPPTAHPTGADALATPEALMRSLDGRVGPAAVSPPLVPGIDGLSPSMARQAAIAKAEGRGKPRPRHPAPEHNGEVRHVDLDLEQLAARGLVTPNAPQSQIADEFRIIKRPIIQNASGRGGTQRVKDGNLVMVTSAVPGEGKTFTSVNLAISIAMEYDNTVLLVDGDVVNPSLPGLLRTPQSPGLLDLLTNEELDVRDVIVKTNVDKLSIIPAGRPHRRATELLASEQMAHLLRELSTRYPDRIVIFDSPPLLATTESRMLAARMGQIVMVVAANMTSHQAVKQAMAAIENCEVVLMMLNKARKSDVGAYYGYYSADAGR